MIQNGEITINNILINKDTTKADFKTNFYSDTKNYLDLLYDFKSPIKLGELEFWVEIAFEDEKLRRIQMKNADPELENSYENWSSKKVEAKRKSHEKWLLDNLGEPTQKSPSGLTYDYETASINSYFDPADGESGIGIDYK